ncbi:hypothetical protein KAJ27_19450 [bacterium]|nr:hypothetical protein [bacterium]
MIYGVGKGFLHENQGSKTKAFRVAQYAALESILKIAAGVRLDDKLKLKELGKGLVEIQIKALITYKEYKTEFINNVEKPYYEIVRRAPIKGVAGLTSKLLKQLKSTPLDWNIFPKEQIKTELSDEKEPWLVLDARKLPQLGSIKPALFPRIISDSGKTIYQLNSVNETALTERGMASYVETSNAVEQSKYLKEPSDTILTQIRAFFTVQDAIADQKGKRRKRRKFIIKEVKQATGLMKTNLLISEKDARDLKAEDASSKILENCRVIVVTNSPIGGIEGDNKYLLAFGIDL